MRWVLFLSVLLPWGCIPSGGSNVNDDEDGTPGMGAADGGAADGAEDGDGGEARDAAVGADAAPCRDTCDRFTCVGGEVFECAPDTVCGEPCSCDVAVADACPDGCEEGRSGDIVQPLCIERTCGCTFDEDCPDGWVCGEDCECVESDVPCACQTDEDCGDAAQVCQACECVPRPAGESCAEVCEARAAAMDEQGHCETEHRHGAPCLPVCQEVEEAASPATLEALHQCIRNDPLCFQDLSDCIFAGLYPEGTEVAVHLEGVGFERFDGRTVRSLVVLDGAAAAAPDVVVQGGAFVQDWVARTFVQSMQFAHLYVDGDDDGRCTADVDFALLGELTRVNDYDAPAYTGVVQGAAVSNGLVCDRF